MTPSRSRNTAGRGSPLFVGVMGNCVCGRSAFCRDSYSLSPSVTMAPRCRMPRGTGVRRFPNARRRRLSAQMKSAKVNRRLWFEPVLRSADDRIAPRSRYCLPPVRSRKSPGRGSVHVRAAGLIPGVETRRRFVYWPVNQFMGRSLLEGQIYSHLFKGASGIRQEGDNMRKIVTVGCIENAAICWRYGVAEKCTMDLLDPEKMKSCPTNPAPGRGVKKSLRQIASSIVD